MLSDYPINFYRRMSIKIISYTPCINPPEVYYAVLSTAGRLASLSLQLWHLARFVHGLFTCDIIVPDSSDI